KGFRRRPAVPAMANCWRLSQHGIVTIPVLKRPRPRLGSRSKARTAPIPSRMHPPSVHYRMSQGAPPSMTARIFKPAKNAMQSGRAKTREWQLDYEPEQPRAIEPLMGWTSSTDMKQQLTLHFETKEDAVAYCERKGIPYQVIEPKESLHRQIAYADNFSFRRGEPWPP